jgi:hypothetical protein
LNVERWLSAAADSGSWLPVLQPATCHPPGLFTVLHEYNVGTASVWDKPTDKFDTPTRVESWRTAPYLHDGSAVTVREVLTTRNPHDQRGKTLNLSNQEIDDLWAYVLSQQALITARSVAKETRLIHRWSRQMYSSVVRQPVSNSRCSFDRQYF